MVRGLRHADLGIAWTWVYDAPFIHTTKQLAVRSGLSVCEITRETVEGVTREVLDGGLQLRWLFDRASDEDDSFRSLASFVLHHHRSATSGAMRCINPADDARRSADKATMHLEFITHGINVPYTIILSPYGDEPGLDLADSDMKNLGSPFIIKPANTTGGGTGVVMAATSRKDIVRHRMTYETDKYLVQQKVHPVDLSGHRAWFRVFYAFGETWLCWWDDRTHIYENVSPHDERTFGLQGLRTSIHTIAKICKLQFFSSEFARTQEGSFVSVDYVNELCDMRPKSTTPDGVPDTLVEWVAGQIVHHVKSTSP